MAGEIPSDNPQQTNFGFVKMIRSPDILELIETWPLAFALAAVIALRARFQPGKSLKGLIPGEAYLGDHDSYGMSRQQYRTSLRHLKTNGFVTTRKTNRGMIARLLDTRLFDVLNVVAKSQTNHQSNQQPTINQPQTKNGKNSNNEKKEGRDFSNSSEAGEIAFEKPDSKQFWKYVEEQNLDADFSEKFYELHQADDWTIDGSPIRFWQQALKAYCEKCETDRRGKNKFKSRRQSETNEDDPNHLDF